MTEVKDRFGKLLSGQCYALYYSLETPFRKRFFNKNKACFLNGATVVDVNLSDFLAEQEQKEGVFNLHFEIVDAQEKKVSSVDLEWILVDSKNKYKLYIDYDSGINKIILRLNSDIVSDGSTTLYVKKEFEKTKRYDILPFQNKKTEISPYLLLNDFKEDGEDLWFFIQQGEKVYYSSFSTRRYGHFTFVNCYHDNLKDQDRAKRVSAENFVLEGDYIKELLVNPKFEFDHSEIFCFRRLEHLKIVSMIGVRVELYTFFGKYPVLFHLKKFYVGKISDNNLDNKPIHQLGNNARYVIRTHIDTNFEHLENLEEIKLEAYISIITQKNPDLCKLQKLKTVEGFRTYAVHNFGGFTVEEFERFKKCLPYTRFIN